MIGLDQGDRLARAVAGDRRSVRRRESHAVRGRRRPSPRPVSGPRASNGRPAGPKPAAARAAGAVIEFVVQGVRIEVFGPGVTAWSNAAKPYLL